MISKFDQHMISYDYHLKAMVAYTFSTPYFLYGYPLHFDDRDRELGLDKEERFSMKTKL